MQKFRAYRDLIDIDYYAYFSKAYFAFNAYLKYKYPEDKDHNRIQNIKSDHVLIQKFENLITGGGYFATNFMILKTALINAQIKNDGEFLLFNNIKIVDTHEQLLFDGTYDRVRYFIKVLNGEKFVFKAGRMTENISCEYAELEQKLNDSCLSPAQISKVKLEIHAHISKYRVDLEPLIADLSRYSDLDRTRQHEVKEKCFKGFITICYSLRNALFHSETEPNTDVMRVYKYAYFILRKIVKSIPS